MAKLYGIDNGKYVVIGEMNDSIASEGGLGSGNFGHSGRPGLRGGSAKKSSGGGGFNENLGNLDLKDDGTDKTYINNYLGDRTLFTAQEENIIKLVNDDWFESTGSSMGMAIANAGLNKDGGKGTKHTPYYKRLQRTNPKEFGSMTEEEFRKVSAEALTKQYKYNQKYYADNKIKYVTIYRGVQVDGNLKIEKYNHNTLESWSGSIKVASEFAISPIYHGGYENKVILKDTVSTKNVFNSYRTYNYDGGVYNYQKEIVVLGGKKGYDYGKAVKFQSLSQKKSMFPATIGGGFINAVNGKISGGKYDGKKLLDLPKTALDSVSKQLKLTNTEVKEILSYNELYY